METSDTTVKASQRLRELIVHAKEGSPIALAAVVRFMQQELPRIAPQSVLSMAEQVLEFRTREMYRESTLESSTFPKTTPSAKWPLNDHADSSTAKLTPSTTTDLAPIERRCK